MVEKVSQLIKNLSFPPDNKLDSLLLKIEAVNHSPEEMSEVLIMLFSIIDTNHKKNQQILSEIASILLLIVTDNKKNQPSPNNKKDSITKKLSSIKGVVAMGGSLLIILLIILFTFNKIDADATQKTIKNINQIEKNIPSVHIK